MRGDYVELLPQYGPLGFNWYDFPHTEWTIGDNVACVQCGEPIRTGHVHDAFRQAEANQEAAEQGAGSEATNEGEAAETAGSKDENVEISAPDAVSDTGIDADAGLYDDVEIEDGLLATVLRMTAAGETQVAIAECCGISVYRVRKLQNGELN